ncbi:MAG: hypothetical protein RLZZ628_2912 [Bacteroidota bacterium]|jgi:hypothetical protein
MSEIRLTIPDEHLSSFLSYLETITYIKVEQVRPPKKRRPTAKSATARVLQSLAWNDPLRQAIKPIRPQVSLETLVQEQHYTGTDWQKLKKIAKDLAIPEPIEVLWAQLKA